jgi:hypothetical protein
LYFVNLKIDSRCDVVGDYAKLFYMLRPTWRFLAMALVIFQMIEIGSKSTLGKLLQRMAI